MSVYSIKDLEHLSGIKAHTIRIWEQRYQLFSPERTETNIRFYDENDLKLILNIAVLKNHGVKISKIVQMTSEEVNQKIIDIYSSEYSHDDQVNSLTVAMLDMNEVFFNSIIESNQERLGFESTMVEIIYPFFKKIGILWMASSINPAQEHFVSNLVRQKIIIETSKIEVKANALNFMLFLPEGELHELGLLYANYVLREKGFKTFYLGQSVPIKDLEEIYHKMGPDFLFTSITSKPSNSEVEEYVQEMGKRFKEVKVLATGNQVAGQNLNIPDNILIVNSLDELDSILQEVGALSIR